MKPTLFISDLHLQAAQPETAQSFFDFLEGPAAQAESLYILGDLFEYWAGDDDAATPFNAQVIRALKTLTYKGVSVFFMAGNRDFLVGEDFAKATGVTLLPDPFVLDHEGHKYLLSHGDLFCTDDIAYQQFKTMVRNPAWQKGFLSKPLAERKAIIENLREKSELDKQTKAASIMDVNLETVNQTFQQHPDATLIHGHTHRPGKSLHDAGLARVCERWVLPEWHPKAGGLRLSNGSLSFWEFP